MKFQKPEKQSFLLLLFHGSFSITGYDIPSVRKGYENMEDANSTSVKSTTVSEEDPWAALLEEALTEAESRLGMEEAITENAPPNPAGTDGCALEIRKGLTLLGAYRIDSEVIPGGMGAVWRVHHLGWDKDLAMKRPKQEFFITEKQKQDFIRECDSWIKLGLHPNIVSCYYVREIGGIPTIFSEWMDNGSLADHIKDRTLYDGEESIIQKRLLDIAIQFARGLHYAHENNLIHQDVKPDNLLLTDVWEARVSDFGLAKAKSTLTVSEKDQTLWMSDPNVTQMAPSGGRTPAYCSPEQAASQPLSRRTDIYSWAISILEMYLMEKPWAHGRELTGPLAGTACRDYFSMCADHPIPAPLQELLAKCLEQKPENRPHDFTIIIKTLLEIYQAVTGETYQKPEPKAASDTADSLNNRALSYLDLGRLTDARKLWDDALLQDPNHVDARFNKELLSLRLGEKYDFQVTEELERIPSVKESGVAKAIARECAGFADPLPKHFLIGSDIGRRALYMKQALWNGTYVFFSGKNFAEGMCIGRFLPDNRGEDLETKFHIMEEGKIKLWNIALLPDRQRAVLALSDCTLCLYDFQEQEPVIITRPDPAYKPLHYTTTSYVSPDGDLLAIYENGTGQSFLLTLPTLTRITQVKMVFLGFLPDGHGLLRGKVTKSKEALYRMDREGNLEEIYRLERVLDKTIEYCSESGVFLAYLYNVKKPVPFYLDKDFKSVPLTETLFQSLRSVHHYEEATGLLCVYRDREYFWDLPKQRCLYTVDIPEIHPSKALYDKKHNRLLLWDEHNYAFLQPLALPSMPYLSIRADWRLSRVISSQERLAQENRLTDLLKNFNNCYSEKDRKGMIQIQRMCLEIPGFGGNEAADHMEDLLEETAQKNSLRAVRKTETNGMIPEMFEHTRSGSLERIGKDILAAYTIHKPEEGIRLYHIDGTLLEHITLPSSAAWVVVRKEKILVFGKMLDVVEYDLHGIPLEPSRNTPAALNPPELNNPKKYGFPVLWDVDEKGMNILYGIYSPFDPFRKKWETGCFQRNLQTGQISRLSGYYDGKRTPKYLGHDSILISSNQDTVSVDDPHHCLRLLNISDGSIKKRFSRFTEYYNISAERDRFLVMDKIRTYLFNSDGKLLENWEKTLWVPVCLPGGRYVCYGTSLNIWDTWEHRMAYRDAADGSILIRPDGRELWLGNQCFRLEYDYR